MVDFAALDSKARKCSWATWFMFCLTANADPWMQALPHLQQLCYLVGGTWAKN